MIQSLKTEESLSKKVAKGGIWVFSLRLAEKSLAMVSLIILARLLAPKDFGLLGVALLTLATFETFSQTGFHAALVQKKENIENYLDIAWTISIFRGVVLFALIFLFAPYVAVFFNIPEASLIIRVVGISIMLESFTNIGIVYFQKELEFNKLFTIQLSGALANFIVAVSAAYILRSVWALVLGVLAATIVKLIISYIMHPHRPRLSTDFRRAKELFVFGKWIFGTSIITFLFNQGDDIFLGKVFGVTSLGFYLMAYKIGQFPATEFAKVVSQVTFPAFSKIQDDFSKLKEGFLKTLNITVFFMTPMAGGIFILSDDFTRIFLTEKWMPMVPALKILVVAGLIRALVTTGGALFQGKGVPEIDFKMNLSRLLIMAVTIYPLAHFFEMSGVALSVALGNFGCVPIWFAEIVKITRISTKDCIRIMYPPLILTLAVSIVILFLKSIIEVDMLKFILICCFAVMTYIVFAGLLEKIIKIGLLDEIKFVISTARGKKR